MGVLLPSTGMVSVDVAVDGGRSSDRDAIATILTYWFGEVSPFDADYRPNASLWFGAAPEIDHDIQQRFGSYLADIRQFLKIDAPVAYDYDHLVNRWAATRDGMLALIVVADQFSRHIYRGSPDMFATDEFSRQLALRIIDDVRLDHRTVFAPFERVFLYLPLEHVEDIPSVARSVELFEALRADSIAAGIPYRKLIAKNYRSAVDHLNIIKPFGRYPYRNAVLGRETTMEEAAFLETHRQSSFMKSVSKRPIGNKISTSATKNPNAPLRILVLHGYRQQGFVMRRACRKLAEALTGEVQFIYIDAPHHYVPDLQTHVDGSVNSSNHGNSHDEARSHQRAWWNTRVNSKGVVLYIGLERTLQYLEQEFRSQGPFDGLLGFSQGATLIGLLSALRDRFPHRFAICVSGFPARATEYADLSTTPGLVGPNLPSFHMYGRHDQHLGPPEIMKNNTIALSALYADNPIVVEHPGGHFTPQDWLVEEMSIFIRSQVDPNASLIADQFEHLLADIPVATDGHQLPVILQTGRQLHRQILVHQRLVTISNSRTDKIVMPIPGLPTRLAQALQATSLREILHFPPSIDMTDQVEWPTLARDLVEQFPDHLDHISAIGFVFLSSCTGTQEARSAAFSSFVLAAMRACPTDLQVRHVKCVVEVVPDYGTWRDLVVLARDNHALSVPIPGLDDAIVSRFVIQLRQDSLCRDASGISEYDDDDEAWIREANVVPPSSCAVGAPRPKSRLNRGINLAQQITEQLFPVDVEQSIGSEADEARRRYLKCTALNSYRSLLADLARRYNENTIDHYHLLARRYRATALLDPLTDKLSVIDRLSTPASRAVTDPEPEPVVPCSLEQLDELLDYMRRHPEGATGQGNNVQFVRGTILDQHRLDLCKQVVGPAGIIPLLRTMITCAPTINTLMIGNNIVGSIGARRIADHIRDSRSAITTWYIAGNNFDAVDVGLICDALVDDDKVTALWLKRNPVLPNGAHHIARLFLHNSTITVLDLLNTGIQDEGAIALFDALEASDCQQLAHLHLDTNHLTERTAARIGAFLASGRSHLQTLSLSCNRIGDEGAKSLAHGLSVDQRLVRLTLASNGIGSDGARLLTRAVCRHPSMQLLGLGYYRGTLLMGGVGNYLGDDGARAIADELIVPACSLRHLDISQNGIGPQAMAVLTSAIQRSTSVVTVVGTRAQLGQARAPEKILGDLEDVLIRNRRRWALETLSSRTNEDQCTTALAELEEKLPYGVVVPEHIANILSTYRTQ